MFFHSAVTPYASRPYTVLQLKAYIFLPESNAIHFMKFHGEIERQRDNENRVANTEFMNVDQTSGKTMWI